MRNRYLFGPLAAVGALILSACSQSPAQKIQTLELGQRVSLGHLAYTVFEAQWHPQIGASPAARVPHDRFLFVRLSVMNGGGEELLIPNVTLEDDKGNSFQELNDGTGVEHWVGFVRRARPAETMDGVILFDVPPQHYRLKINDENDERAAYIDLPLTFDSDLPNLTEPTPFSGPAPASPGRK
jgi:hypothetical protein